MVNLLQETWRVLANYGKSFKDVKWIECDGKEIPIELFYMKADTEYNNDYGCIEVIETLKVVGDGWWLERAEYDGSEWWEFKAIPQRPAEPYGYDFSPIIKIDWGED